MQLWLKRKGGDCMEIKFNNGNTIETIDSTSNVRSRCDENKIKILQETFKNPHMLLGSIYYDLHWYQKLSLRMSYFINKKLGLYKYRRR